MSTFVANILLVDDYEMNLELLEAYLHHGKIDCRIYTASNGTEALDVLNTTEIDLVLLDVMLPDIDGYAICNHIKYELKNTTLPVIMITALNDRESMIKGLAAGADDFLTKPVHRHELLIRVENLLKLRQVTSALDYQYQKLREDLAIAKSLQNSFLPNHIPNFSGIGIEAVYEPSIEIGGDFYDFLEISSDLIGIFIADVKGHGVASAMITAILKDNLNKCKECWRSPERLMEQLNQQLYSFFSSTQTDYFVTAFYLVINTTTGKITFSNAGHLPMISILSNRLLALDTETGFPLGLFDVSSYLETTTQWEIDDQLFLFTDGLYELELFDSINDHDSLVEFLEKDKNSSLTLQLDRLKLEIKKKIKDGSLIDDINYISIKRSFIFEEERLCNN